MTACNPLFYHSGSERCRMPKKYEDEKYALPYGISDVVQSYDLMLEKIRDPAERDATIETMAERMREHYRQTGQKSISGTRLRGPERDNRERICQTGSA